MTKISEQAAGKTGRLHGRTRQRTLKEALALSELHLALASLEFWERWETVAARKRELYKIIEECNRTPMDPEELETAAAILDLEQRMVSVLLAKRRQTLEDLHDALEPPPAGKPGSFDSGRVLRVAC